MQDLCDKASVFGLSRNQTYTLIHSRRAACLFMLTRGIVGLVGRDEAANPEDYGVSGLKRKRVRPGHEIGCDDEGSLSADIQVRRSVREQGLGLPWPFSLVLLNDSSHLFIDDERIPLTRKPNGDLDLPQLPPGSVVRIALRVGRRNSVLTIDTRARSRLMPITLTRTGTRFKLGLPPEADRPGWVAEFERKNFGRVFENLDEVFSALPTALSERRRVYAIHGLVALGIVRHSSRGWRITAGHPIPSQIVDAFESALNDPGAYPALVGNRKASTAWLVRAGWLSTTLGWSIVRHNDLTRDVELDPALSDAAIPNAIGIREAALMRIVETAEQALDRLAHPSHHDLLNETRVLVGRYLTALGYTAYRAVRELKKCQSGACIVYGHSANSSSGLWLLKPIGAPILEEDLDAAQREAKATQVKTWAVTNGLFLTGVNGNGKFQVDLREVAQNEESFACLIRLAADPSDFEDKLEHLRENGG